MAKYNAGDFVYVVDYNSYLIAKCKIKEVIPCWKDGYEYDVVAVGNSFVYDFIIRQRESWACAQENVCPWYDAHGSIKYFSEEEVSGTYCDALKMIYRGRRMPDWFESMNEEIVEGYMLGRAELASSMPGKIVYCEDYEN